MRVALVHMRHAGTGGTERYLNQIAAHLASLGHEPVVICRSHEEAPHPGVRFQLLRPFSIGSGWRTMSFARAVEKHLRRSRYDLVFALGRTWSQDVLRLGGGCHRTWLETGYAVGKSAAARRAGKARGRHRAALRIEERALRPGACRRIIANSQMVKRDVIGRFGLSPSAVEVIYNGADLERFHPGRRAKEGARLRRELGFAPDDLVVLFLGSGYARKGLDVVIQAFARHLRQRRDVKLLVVGYDSTPAVFETLAGRLRVENVHFAGGRRDAERCYAAADLYVLPTRYDPFANSTLEALAAGLPVLTSDANGGGELIENGVQGEVVPVAGGPKAFGAALSEWADRDRVTEASARARSLAEAHSVEAKMEETTRLLKAVAREVDQESTSVTRTP
jgi:UDP-glucose:(heptosyl)LPS alpha-1,3-glucosyltransferase